MFFYQMIKNIYGSPLIFNKSMDLRPLLCSTGDGSIVLYSREKQDLIFISVLLYALISLWEHYCGNFMEIIFFQCLV